MDLDWRKIKEEEFSPIIKLLRKLQQNNLQNDFYSVANNALKISAKLLISYYNFCGLYPENNVDIFKTAFYNDIIQDGHLYVSLYIAYTEKNLKLNIEPTRILSGFEQLEEYIQKEIELYYG